MRPLFAALLTASLLIAPHTMASASAHESEPLEIAPPLCFTQPAVTPGVIRIGGTDRFAVSAAVSAATFADTDGTVFIASGASYPDALSGSADAGRQDAPVLLVTADTVSPEVKTELQRLQPRRIIVLGGTTTISEALEFSMEAYAPEIIRYGGADRFAVSARIAEDFRGLFSTAYVATGSGFADALSASAAAGKEGGPVLLVGKDSIPSATLDILKGSTFLDAIRVVGGPDTISDSVIVQLAEIAKTNRITGDDRFTVSAGTSAHTFCPNQSTVYIASGAVFPDALSGSAAAIHDLAPVLLVNTHTIPEPIERELERLKPARIVVLGGSNTIGDDVVTDLAAYLRP